jgi:hypothetical protein
MITHRCRGLTPQLLSQEGALFQPGVRRTCLTKSASIERKGGQRGLTESAGGSAADLLRARGSPHTKLVLTVLDAAGKQVRQLDATNKSGLHRTPWDLREPPPAAAPQGGRGGGGGGRGPARIRPVGKTGNYQVTLGKLTNGTLTPIGQPVTVEVDK